MGAFNTVAETDRSRLQQVLVAAVRVAKAYQAAISATKNEKERLWLEEGLRNSIYRAEKYRRVLDPPRQECMEAS